MDEQVQRYKADSLMLCNSLLNMLNEDRDDIDSFFGGEINKEYTYATEKAISKVNRIRMKIRNL